MSSLVNELRQKIDLKYQRALQSLHEIEGYLAESNGQVPQPTVLTPAKQSKRKREGSMRARVLEVIRSDWASVNQIKEKTGLEHKQVRGVINAPTLNVEHRDTEGERQYRLKQQAE